MKHFRKIEHPVSPTQKYTFEHNKARNSANQLYKLSPTYQDNHLLKELKFKQKKQPLNNDQIPKELTNMQIDSKFYPLSAKNKRQLQTKTNGFNQQYFRSKDTDWLNQNSSKSPSVNSRDANPNKQKSKNNGSQYDKLHEKLNFIQNKISQMKSNLQKKRQEKAKKIQQQQKCIKNQFINNLKKRQYQQNIIKQQAKVQGQKDNNLLLQKLQNLVTKVPQHKQLQSLEFDPYSPKHNIYYVSEIVKAYKIQNSTPRQHVITSLHILKLLQNSKMPNQQQISSKVLSLTKSKYSKTVVFDLDQTLIHCNDNLNAAYDVKLPIKFPTGQVIEAGINVRPGARQILKKLSENFEIIVFTASHSCYANVVIDYLDPQRKYVNHRLFRQHCYHSPENFYIKDLRIINRNLSDMILIDNAAYSYAYQIDNGIPIIPYYHGKTDYELKALQKYIQSMIFVKDVREVNRKTFKINKYREYYDNPDRLVNELYLENQN